MANANKNNSVTVNFEVEKVTKNTIRFAEKLENEFSAPVIGTLYVPKSTLGQIGYADGKTLCVSLMAK